MYIDLLVLNIYQEEQTSVYAAQAILSMTDENCVEGLCENCDEGLKTLCLLDQNWQKNINQHVSVK